MDFVLITPDKILVSHQQWLLWRDSDTYPSFSVQDIRIHKQWLLDSIANIGTLELIAGDNIVLHYVDAPERTRDNIRAIIHPVVEEIV